MLNLTDIGEVRRILEKFGFSFSKALGQNFIVNPSVCPRIAEHAGIGPEDCVLEIGPGIGVLTKELAQVAHKVVAVELDKRLPDVLAYTLEDFDNVTVVSGDALQLDLKELIATHFEGKRVHICANLPYYITTPLIMKFLDDGLPVSDITVMVQREVADRLCAPVGSRDTGAVTVAVNYYATVEKCFGVSRGSFMPAPNVDSAVIKLTLCDKPAVETDKELFFKLVKAAFAQRRKTVVNSVSAGVGVPKAQVTQVLEECGLSPTVRAEQLTLQNFADITSGISRLL